MHSSRSSERGVDTGWGGFGGGGVGGGITPGPRAPRRGPPVSRGRFTPEGRAHRLCSPKIRPSDDAARLHRARYIKGTLPAMTGSPRRGASSSPRKRILFTAGLVQGITPGGEREPSRPERESGAHPAVSQMDYPVRVCTRIPSPRWKSVPGRRRDLSTRPPGPSCQLSPHPRKGLVYHPCEAKAQLVRYCLL